MLSVAFALVAALLPTVVLAQAPVWGQCGGTGWTGPTTCVAGSTCTYQNQWYSQCLPGASTPTSTSTTTRSTSTSTRSTSTTTTNTRTTTSTGSNPTGTTGLRLRVLPLGDSITFGLQSSDGNGYRGTLHTRLEPGNTVDFIGSVKAGQMADNDNEGHSGWTIDQILGAAKYTQALPAKPNLVLLHAGTNDIYGGNFGTAINRLATLVDYITTNNPDTTLLLSTLVPYPASQSQVNTFNQNVTNLAANRAAAGKKVVLTSMAALTSSDLADGVHPNNGGYQKMATAWYAAFVQAANQGFITPPL